MKAISTFPLRSSLLLVAAILMASATFGYTVILKDGSQIVAQKKYEIQGDRARIVLENGTTTTVPLDAIHVAKTNEYNKSDYGRAIVVGRGGNRPLTRGEDRQETLGTMIQGRSDRDEEADGPSTRAKTRKTGAGYNDLNSIQRQPLAQSSLADQIGKALEKAGLDGFKIHQGTTKNRVLLELRTETEKEVFKALQVSANTYGLIKDTERSLEAFEVLMLTGTKSRAGQFVLDKSNTPLLINQRMSVSDFFVEYVQF